MAAIRREEQTEAAAHVGVDDLVFLGQMDGEVVHGLELRHAISRVIRQVRPRVVITQSPELNLQRIYSESPRSCRDRPIDGGGGVSRRSESLRLSPELLTSGLEPWSVDELWIMGHGEPSDDVDVTAQVDRKMAALHCHRSQHPILPWTVGFGVDEDDGIWAGLDEGSSLRRSS